MTWVNQWLFSKTGNMKINTVEAKDREEKRERERETERQRCVEIVQEIVFVGKHFPKSKIFGL